MVFFPIGLAFLARYAFDTEAALLAVLAMDAMMLLILVHAGAAIFHHYVLKDGLLRRMTRVG